MNETDLMRRVVDRALELVAAGRSFDDILEDALDILSDSRPSPIWSTIASLDRDGDVRGLAGWVLNQMADHPPPAHLTALWFGLYEIGPAASYPTGAEAVLELTGGPGFPDDPEWLFKQDWHPGGYAPTPGLRSLLSIGAASDDASAVVSYAVVFTYAIGLVSAALEFAGPALLMPGIEQLGIAVGFHDGDIAALGVLGGAGLDRAILGWA